VSRVFRGTVIGVAVGELLTRFRILLTGRTEWLDESTGRVEVIHEDWETSWAIAGFHSHNWWWVRKYGKRDCGCTINPITRRRVLTLWGCATHCAMGWDEEDPDWLGLTEDDWV
jgi:hypothetical protein